MLTSQIINSFFVILKIFSLFRFLNSFLEECDQLAENQLNDAKLLDAEVISNIKSLHCEKRELKALLKKVKIIIFNFKIQCLSLAIYANMKGLCKKHINSLSTPQ